MTVPEATKINDLYKQLDVLTAENATLKGTLEDKSATNDLELKLSSIESKLDKLLGKSK